jgi:hypothetical protein
MATRSLFASERTVKEWLATMTRKEVQTYRLQQKTAALTYAVHRLLTAMPRAIGDIHKRAERLNARRKACHG